jgi:hypothetical protein
VVCEPTAFWPWQILDHQHLLLTEPVYNNADLEAYWFQIHRISHKYENAEKLTWSTMPLSLWRREVLWSRFEYLEACPWVSSCGIGEVFPIMTSSPETLVPWNMSVITILINMSLLVMKFATYRWCKAIIIQFIIWSMAHTLQRMCNNNIILM